LPRSPGGSDGPRRPSRRTCTTHLTLTKGLRKPRRDARRVWRPPAHKADPGLSRAERTPPWRGGASPTPDPVRHSSARQGALLERVREPAVGWQQPPVGRSAQLGDRGPTTDPDRRGYRNRGKAQLQHQHPAAASRSRLRSSAAGPSDDQSSSQRRRTRAPASRLKQSHWCGCCFDGRTGMQQAAGARPPLGGSSSPGSGPASRMTAGE